MAAGHPLHGAGERRQVVDVLGEGDDGRRQTAGLLAGGLGGTLKTGRVLDYLKASEDNRKMCSLYLSLLDRFGINAEHFGDSETRLEGI